MEKNLAILSLGFLFTATYCFFTGLWLVAILELGLLFLLLKVFGE